MLCVQRYHNELQDLVINDAKMAEEKEKQLEEWARIKDMTKQAISTVADRENKMENWKKNQRAKLLKTKAECIEWLEL